MFETMDLINEQRDTAEDKLSNQKYLSYEEMKKIINEYKESNFDGENEWEEIPDYNFNKIITAICNLSIPEQKYCSRKGVEDIFVKYGLNYADNSCAAVDDLLDLAIQPITKDRIILDLKCELMNKYCTDGWISPDFDGILNWFDKKLGIKESKPEQIANEILNNKPIEDKE